MCVYKYKYICVYIYIYGYHTFHPLNAGFIYIVPKSHFIFLMNGRYSLLGQDFHIYFSELAVLLYPLVSTNVKVIQIRRKSLLF